MLGFVSLGLSRFLSEVCEAAVDEIAQNIPQEEQDPAHLQ